MSLNIDTFETMKAQVKNVLEKYNVIAEQKNIDKIAQSLCKFNKLVHTFSFKAIIQEGCIPDKLIRAKEKCETEILTILEDDIGIDFDTSIDIVNRLYEL